MDKNSKALLFAVTELLTHLAEETASLMETHAQQLHGQHVREQRERARHIRETGRQVLELSERVRQGES